MKMTTTMSTELIPFILILLSNTDNNDHKRKKKIYQSITFVQTIWKSYFVACYKWCERTKSFYIVSYIPMVVSYEKAW